MFGQRFWKITVVAIVVLVLMPSCQQSPPSVSEPEPVVDLTNKSPAELFETIQVSSTSASEVAELLESGSNYRLRLEEFRRHIETGTAAANAIAQHDAATDVERQQATLAKLQLLYTAATTDRATFETRLEEDVRAIIAQDPGGQEAIVAEAILLQVTCLLGDATHAEKMKTLIDFAKRHRGVEVAATLFLRYGEVLESEGRDREASDCYRTAVQLFPSSTQLQSVRTKLAADESARLQDLASGRAYDQKVQAIKHRLVRDDGYFVIYTRESNKTLYRFEYSVLQGAEAAVNHILALPKDWEWDLTARYSETPEGYTRAQALADKRNKEETVMRVPSF